MRSCCENSPMTTNLGFVEDVQPMPIFQAREATFDIFSKLVSEWKQRRFTWTALKATLADLKFSIIPKSESVFTFCPSANRPHKSEVEGLILFYFAGWFDECLWMGLAFFWGCIPCNDAVQWGESHCRNWQSILWGFFPVVKPNGVFSTK